MGRTVEITIQPRQKVFIEATQTEVLFGGAAGGGKSHGQVIDALLFALKYPGSKQLILRRSFAELEKSIVRTVLRMYPREIFTYNSSSHTGKFKNGSLLDLGYVATENDVYQYQSAEYDVIRFDELTHFTEEQYTYLISRIRGANNFPKQIKSSTNPGGVGHTWVKRRFIVPAPPNVEFEDKDGNTRIFIPSRIDDNKALLDKDPNYKKRLLTQSENNVRALLYGDWDIFEGQYFEEFRAEDHVIEPFEIPREWRKYRAIDYGLDMLACVFVAVDSTGCCYAYKETGGSNLSIGRAAGKVIDFTERDEDIYCTLAPPDLWNRSQESGKSKAALFSEAGLDFTKSNNDREAGWLAIKELLRKDANGEPRLKIFSNCRELIRCLPALIRDEKKPTDCATEPHDITHYPDALRYFAVYWYRAAESVDNSPRRVWTEDMWEDYYAAGSESEREYIMKKYGKPK